LRVLALIFAALVVGLQYPIWLGKGGWLRVRDLDRQVEAQRQLNAELKARNSALDAEVRDLKQGFEAVEERARSELGMLRQDEVFFQLPSDDASKPSSTPPQRKPGAQPRR
jgi:cell division protein FtsB